MLGRVAIIGATEAVYPRGPTATHGHAATDQHRSAAHQAADLAESTAPRATALSQQAVEPKGSPGPTRAASKSATSPASAGAPEPPAGSPAYLEALRQEIAALDLSGRSRKEIGDIGEDLAAVVLAEQGWVPIHSDTGRKGIDLLMYHPEREELLVVEVKATSVGKGGFATTPQKVAGVFDGTYQAGPEWVSDRLVRAGFPGLEDVEEGAVMRPTLGIKVDLLNNEITYYSSPDGHRWTRLNHG